jgi:hypothetical protein
MPSGTDSRIKGRAHDSTNDQVHLLTKGTNGRLAAGAPSRFMEALGQ